MSFGEGCGNARIMRTQLSHDIYTIRLSTDLVEENAVSSRDNNNTNLEQRCIY